MKCFPDDDTRQKFLSDQSQNEKSRSLIDYYSRTFAAKRELLKQQAHEINVRFKDYPKAEIRQLLYFQSIYKGDRELQDYSPQLPEHKLIRIHPQSCPGDRRLLKIDCGPKTDLFQLFLDQMSKPHPPQLFQTTQASHYLNAIQEQISKERKSLYSQQDAKDAKRPQAQQIL